MVTREKIRQKRKRLKLRKYLAGTLLIILIIGSSMQVSFADQGISGIINNWFNKKTEESIEKIDKSISTEQEMQTERLKEALRLEIESAEKQLQTTVDEEKLKRVQELEKYVDELLDHVEVNNKELKKEKIDELDHILETAKAEMNEVGAGQAKESKTDEENGNGASND